MVCRLVRRLPLLAALVAVVALLLACVALPPAAAHGDTEGDTFDFYEVLGLEKERDDATERDIKSAWRRLSKKYHPDIAGNAAEESRDIYRRIQRSYEVLSDRRKRKVFDILGHEGLAKLEQPLKDAGGPQHPFMHLFGFGAGEDEKGADVEMVMEVPLEDIYLGAAHNVKFSKTKICRHCRGTGARSAEDVVQCPHCDGSGRVVRRVQLAPGFYQQVQQPCPRCGGRGQHVAAACPHCHGSKVLDSMATIGVDVEAGTPEGAVLVYELDADQQPGLVPGDVRLTVVTAPHPVFSRGSASDPHNDLRAIVVLSLREALLGFERTLTHLDGHTVSLHRRGTTQHLEEERVAGEGLPRQHTPSERGDLYVTYKVRLPPGATLSTADRAAWADAFPE